MSALQYEEIKPSQHATTLKLEQNLYIPVTDYQASGACHEGAFEWGLSGDASHRKLLIEE